MSVLILNGVLTVQAKSVQLKRNSNVLSLSLYRLRNSTPSDEKES